MRSAWLEHAADGWALGYRGAGALQFADAQEPAPSIPPPYLTYYASTVDGSLKDFGLDVRRAISRLVQQGASEGWTQARLMREVQAAASGLKGWQASRIARTETMRLWNLGSYARMEQAPDEDLVGYEYDVVEDDRTSSVCRPLDGLKVKRDELRHIPPLHPNCRTKLQPLYAEDAPEEWGNPSAPSSVPGFAHSAPIPESVRAGMLAYLKAEHRVDLPDPLKGIDLRKVLTFPEAMNVVQETFRFDSPSLQQHGIDADVRDALAQASRVLKLEVLMAQAIVLSADMDSTRGGAYIARARVTDGSRPGDPRIVISAYRGAGRTIWHAPIHEIGHALDHHFLLAEGFRMSAKTLSTLGLDKDKWEYASQFAALDRGSPMGRLMGVLHGLDSTTRQSIMESGWTGEQIEYYLGSQELFARAFERWATSRMGLPAQMTRHLEERDREGFWTDSEWQRIDSAMTSVLSSVGLTREGSMRRPTVVGRTKFSDESPDRESLEPNALTPGWRIDDCHGGPGDLSPEERQRQGRIILAYIKARERQERLGNRRIP